MPNEGFEYSEQIGPASVGQDVVEHLALRFRHSSAATWRARVEAGEVLVDGVVAQAGSLLRAGQRLAWRRPPWEEPQVPLAFALLHRDGELLAVAKPRGLPSVPAGGFLTHTLLHLVRRLHPEAAPLHRLGRGTSGLVLFARTAAARAALAAQWRAGSVDKLYRALVCGQPRCASFEVDVPIGPRAHPRLGQVHAASANGRAALTRVRVLGERAHGVLVEARIPTGRPHQIRIHLAAAGHPLVGDSLYAVGGGLRDEPGLPGDGGYWLHAHRLSFRHPASGELLALECVPPPSLR